MRRRRPLKIGLVALLTMAACALVRIPAGPHAPHVDQWKGGDVVFLTGTSIRSKVVRLLQGYSTDFSHVGIIVFTENRPYIIHADPASGKVVRQRWESLVASGDISGGAVFRVRSAGPDAINRACQLAERCVAQELPFDHQFDLNTSERLFCTELVLRAYRAGNVDLDAKAETTHPHLLPAHLLNDQLDAIDRF